MCPIVVGAAKIAAPLQIALGVDLGAPEFADPVGSWRWVPFFGIAICACGGDIQKSHKKEAAVIGLYDIIRMVMSGKPEALFPFDGSGPVEFYDPVVMKTFVIAAITVIAHRIARHGVATVFGLHKTLAAVVFASAVGFIPFQVSVGIQL